MNSTANASRTCRAWWATSPLPGAIGILHLDGDPRQVLDVLGTTMPRVGASVFAKLGDIDDGIIARPKDNSLLIMPHGGPRIRQLITDAVCTAGAELLTAEQIDPSASWPEASSTVEAYMLDALERTESPRAIDLLLKQPGLHATAHSEGWEPNDLDLQRAKQLRWLLEPPLIAIVGRPNVGKSTLMNRLAGREVAITADVAGTTRDAVTARIQLDGVACDIVDLPGYRASDDPIEEKAIALSERFLRDANFVLGLVEPEHLELPELQRMPELTVCNKADLGSSSGLPEICAIDGQGVQELALRIRRALISDELLAPLDRPWIFHPSLT